MKVIVDRVLFNLKLALVNLYKPIEVHKFMFQTVVTVVRLLTYHIFEQSTETKGTKYK